MRIWGRVDGQWVQVDTLQGDSQEAVYLTWLAQVLQLSRNESPFFANWGIPQVPTIVQQIDPDYYVTLTQQQMSRYFASLQIRKEAGYRDPETGEPNPRYVVSVVTLQGTPVEMSVPI